MRRGLDEYSARACLHSFVQQKGPRSQSARTGMQAFFDTIALLSPDQSGRRVMAVHCNLEYAVALMMPTHACDCRGLRFILMGVGYIDGPNGLLLI